ncbi:glycosyltransferase family 2 protein [Aestuariibacter sp. GS-14]|uniref:glycosyltransferase family 2 protein n=1 Tax=Aestuariibacter sp. GS-14 TaxID=2590670 RepID=UPI001127197C|nr:glycosyltransferase family 2 protein [Aestuariibacter sp. GS-14]TPV58551.1 glycosyltransferase family 2 protein [Aestuariibacter sp. GS-14]
MSAFSLSIVVPLYKEQENVNPLITRIHQTLADCPNRWELICVDDGSPDATSLRVKECREQLGSHIRLVSLQRNYGQTAAMQAGIDAARGDLIVTLDGDLQNDPADIPAMIEQLIERDLDMLQGWRQNRQDGWLLRKLPSWLANKLIAKITGVRLRDYGCSLKVYRASVLRQIRLFGEMHRFIPVWVASVTQPSRIGECPVRHHARQFGESKYGLSRTFRVILDLLSVFFFLRFSARPGHFFGYLGLWFGSFGSMIMSYLLIIKFGFGQDIGSRPLFFIGILLLVASMQFITTGVLAEMLSRVFFQATNARGYTLRSATPVEQSSCWFDNAKQPESENASGINRVARK